MHGTRRSVGGGTSDATARTLPSHAQLIARAVTLIAELSTTLAALGVAAESVIVAPVVEAVGALSTKEAAKRLGCSPYTLAERVRRGELHARQDAKGGPYYYDLEELERYSALKQTGRLAHRIPESYSTGYDQPGIPRVAVQTSHDATGGRRGARRDRQHGGPVGTRRARHKPASGACTLAPGKGAWSDDDPEG